jgi:hypothetical protein
MAKKSKRNRTQGNQSSGTAAYIFDGVVSLTRPLIEAKKEWGVQRLTEFADATQEYATSLKDIPNVGSYAKATASSLQELVDYVNDTDIDQMLKDASNFAKRNPLPMIVAGAIAGLILTQTLRSNGLRFKSRGSNRSHLRPPKSGPSARKSSSARQSNGSSHVSA